MTLPRRFARPSFLTIGLFALLGSLASSAGAKKNVRKIQKTYRIVPLKRWNPNKPYAYKARKPKKPDRTMNDFHVPGTAAGEDAATFFDALVDKFGLGIATG